MKIPLLKEHQSLLMQREGRVVVGKKAVNLWLLVAVLTATFLSIAFSAGSMVYLDDKMNDPFTYWLNVYRDGSPTNFNEIADELEKDSLSQRYLYDGVQTQFGTSLDLFDRNNGMQVFRIQHYEDMGSDLVEKVLGEENVIQTDGHLVTIAHDSISPRSLGVIMTLDAIQSLGYSRVDLPSFVDCRVPSCNADTLGFKVVEDYLRAPIPLLAVVRRLPMNKDMLASKYLNIQYSDKWDANPFNLSKEHHARDLYFFVPEGVEGFDQGAYQCIPDSLQGGTAAVLPTEDEIAERLRSWRKGVFKTVYVNGRPPLAAINEIAEKILRQYGPRGVVRVYDYEETYNKSESDNGLSIHFTSLDSIRAFERYMKNTHKYQIEMTQVNAKENFNAVSIMATILSAAMIVFSIVCIIIFLTNMLQSYFQKVRRNLGTFRAFGMSNRELIRVYVVILISIVAAALTVALVVTWLLEGALQLLGVMKDGSYSWLILWNSRTLWAIVIIIGATILTVLFVMRRLLRQTPGNLIYDR